MTIDERKAALRAAQKLVDTGAAPILDALDGATEDERLVLRKTLPPTRLLKAEGPTPRALAALVGLGPGVNLHDVLWEYKHDMTALMDVYDGVLSAAARERDDAWVAGFIEAVGELHLLRRGLGLGGGTRARRRAEPVAGHTGLRRDDHQVRELGSDNTRSDPAGIAAFFRSDRRRRRLRRTTSRSSVKSQFIGEIRRKSPTNRGSAEFR